MVETLGAMSLAVLAAVTVAVFAWRGRPDDD